jgi:hypothetical protein
MSSEEEAWASSIHRAAEAVARTQGARTLAAEAVASTEAEEARNRFVQLVSRALRTQRLAEVRTAE